MLLSNSVDNVLKNFLEIQTAVFNQSVLVRFRNMTALKKAIERNIPSKYDIDIISYLNSRNYISSNLTNLKNEILKIYKERK